MSKKEGKIMKNLIVNLIFLTIVFTGFVYNNAYADTPQSAAHTKMSASEFKLDMRKLWEDHVMWTRNVILNIIDDLGGTDKAVERLLKNQDDIGNAVKQFYGDEAGKKLTELLYAHITIAADLLKAAKSNDENAFKEINKKWYDNADEIAGFLSSANPNWTKDEMTMMMHDHLALTTDEAVARLKKDYAADVSAYDKVHNEIISMSDMLAEGIIKQFPEKFSK